MSETECVFPATILRPVDHEIVIKKSRFIAHITPLTTSDAAEEALAAIRKREWNARHHCTAQITGLLGDRARSSDDGEPAGTAGIPMLEVLRRHELTDVLAVVTRYFGGVKLGAGGLIRAYSSAVSEALDHATLVDRKLLSQALVEVPHAAAGRFDNVLREWAAAHDAVLGEAQYGHDARFEVWADAADMPQLQAELAAASAGAVAAHITGVERVINVTRA